MKVVYNTTLKPVKKVVGLEAVQDIAQMESWKVRQELPVERWQAEGYSELTFNLPLGNASGEQPSNLQSPNLQPSIFQPSNRILITGGAGFIGTNLAHRLLTAGQSVLLFDNLSRPGVEQNLRWLQQRHGDLVQIQVADVRDRFALRQALKNTSQVFHFAAQVAVTASLTNPVHDFEINALGTLNLLEELRSLSSPPSLVFTSTNKVYGKLPDIQLVPNCTRYQPVGTTGVHESPLLGISEEHSLDFHSPYGCSKGAADQYVLDYARTFGIPAVVLGHSCVLSWWEAVKGEAAPASWDRYREEVRRGLQAANLVIAPSAAMLAGRFSYYGEIVNSKVIPNGRDSAVFYPSVKKEFVLTAGRLWDEAKNVAALEDIAPQLL